MAVFFHFSIEELFLSKFYFFLKDLFKERAKVIQIILLLFAFIFVIRLAYLQLLDNKYTSLARKNAVKEIEIYPTRGLVYDRDSQLIVFNEALYDLMAVPREVKDFDTVQFCSLLKISIQDFYDKWNKMKERKDYSRVKPNVFMKQISMENYARLQEFLYSFKGFYGQVRSVRKYPIPYASLILGDIGEVDERQIKESKGYYRSGDYVGKNGIEKYYERELGGTQGKKYIFVDAFSREQGSFANGQYDTMAKAGNTIYTTIDMELQALGEKLMQNKKGSIVAIEPQTGEILCLVSSPSFDPNLLCGALRGENFKALQEDSLKPLFNRATMATYPPGSTFKPLVGLIALNEEVQGVEYTVPCNGVYFIGSKVLHCSHIHPWAHNIQYALAQSCNPYFWQTFRNCLENTKYSTVQESYGKWIDYARGFGLGARLGIDLPSEAKGNIPTVNYYNKMYGEKGWRAVTIISLGIGQGEMLVTPLQLCNMYAAIANKGWYIPPHVARKIIDASSKKDVQKKFEKTYTKISPIYFDPVKEGLYDVVMFGTATGSRVDGITLCGKTGTIQNPHGDNHSSFSGFAPKDNPKIAIAVFVENAGFGAKYAGPIASLMVEKYLNDTIADNRKSLEKKMTDINLIYKYFTPKKEPIDSVD